MKKLLDLVGVGSKTCLLFNKLGIDDVYDLITFYPKRYDVLVRSDMDKVMDKDKVIIDGVVEGRPVNGQSVSGIRKISFRIVDGKGIYNILVYNQVYLLKELRVGMNVIVIGKYDRGHNLIIASEVRIGKLPKKAIIEPIYGATEGLSRKTIARIIEQALQSDLEIVDFVPDYLRDRYHFMDKMSAIRQIHCPSDRVSYKRAKQCLKYEELFLYLLKIRYLKYLNGCNVSDALNKEFSDDEVNNFIKMLPFELTSDQLKVIESIKDDMRASRQMNRLVQGDVGSGKTIVAMIAAYINYLAGYQTALMVPTEILAKQHYQEAIKLFKNTDMKIALLTSSLSLKKREVELKRISNGEVNFIIGTQSLIQSKVFYNNLGLIVCDEQHRFGVNQRALLREKGRVPDILAMSATPIPRTYALTIYGDMDVSSIRTKPIGRKPVSTFCKKESDMLDVLKMMKLEIDKGHQVYVIVPSIDDNDDMGKLDNVVRLKEKMELAFGKICEVGCVHGKLDSNLKEEVMHRFLVGEIKILISTTVIEVGVNVPNASMMVIFQANLFGLSTLHQLRGRVGRGSIQSYCILIANSDSDRLKIMEDTNDGFLISEADFKNRGSGDLFGVRQSGQARFKLADLVNDFALLVRVKEDVVDFFDNYIESDSYSKFFDYLDIEKALD